LESPYKITAASPGTKIYRVAKVEETLAAARSRQNVWHAERACLSKITVQKRNIVTFVVGQVSPVATVMYAARLLIIQFAFRAKQILP
jgi:hypothetical protein